MIDPCYSPWTPVTQAGRLLIKHFATADHEDKICIPQHVGK